MKKSRKWKRIKNGRKSFAKLCNALDSIVKNVIHTHTKSASGLCCKRLHNIANSTFFFHSIDNISLHFLLKTASCKKVELGKYHFLYLDSTLFGHYIYTFYAVNWHAAHAKKKSKRNEKLNKKIGIKMQFSSWIVVISFVENVLALHKTDHSRVEMIMRAAYFAYLFSRMQLISSSYISFLARVALNVIYLICLDWICYDEVIDSIEIRRGRERKSEMKLNRIISSYKYCSRIAFPRMNERFTHKSSLATSFNALKNVEQRVIEERLVAERCGYQVNHITSLLLLMTEKNLIKWSSAFDE